MLKITIIAGARPNFMKIAPIVRTIESVRKQGKQVAYRLIYTGTETDASIEASLFSDLQMKTPDKYLNAEGNTSIELAASIMVAFERELLQNPAHIVLVVDDFTATMSCAIVAKKHNVKVAHLVAGTRSFDLDMPKEVNRMVTDGLSDYHFIAGMTANRNLNQTGTLADNVYFVGNILIDTIRFNRNQLIKPIWFSSLNIKEHNYLLLTINRHALIRDKKNLKKLIETIIYKSKGLPVIAPLHTYVRDVLTELQLSAPNLHVLPPQSYLHFGYLVNNAKGIITDSGNVAEEATFLQIPCITLNSYAEHPETWQVGTNVLVGESPEKLSNELDTLMNGHWKDSRLPERWDGRTAERIVQILLD